MADPTAITGIVLAVAAAATSATPLVLARRARAQDRENAGVASWEALNNALDREIRRLQDEIARQREEYQRQLSQARRRITDLEQEVAALQRTLRGGT